MLKRMFCQSLVLGIVLSGILVPSVGWSWGAEGHKMVALIAQQRLTPKAKANLQKIMGNEERGWFVPKEVQDPTTIAMERLGVNLGDDRAVLSKLQSLQGKMPDVSDLSNLWQDLQEQKDKRERLKKAA